MTLIRTPFKRKRSTITGDGKRSPSMTPRSARHSTARSSSVGSSVNSYEESEFNVATNINASTKNIYADIESVDDDKCGFTTNKPIECDQRPPELPAANSAPKNNLKILQVSTINECENFEECVEVTEDDLLKIPGIENELNCSKNNLLLIDDHLMASSIDNHLNNIEIINKNLDKLLEVHREIENDEEDDATSPEAKAEKKKLKQKIADKIKLLKEARMIGASSSDASTKEYFKKRVKNIFPRFEKQTSPEDENNYDKPKSSGVKGFLSSFKRKPVVDETDDDFEEIKKVEAVKVTDLDESSKANESKGENLSSRFKLKLKLTANMISSKMSKKSSQTCRQCHKRFNVTPNGNRINPTEALLDFNIEKLSDNEFCVCVDVDDVSDDGFFLKNFEYKDVSCFRCFIFGMLHLKSKLSISLCDCLSCSTFVLLRFRKA